MLGEVVKSITVGVRRRWKTGVARALSAVGAIWLATSIIAKVFPKTVDDWMAQHGNLYISVVVVAGVVWFLLYTYEVRSVSFLVPTTDSQINVRFGDLLAQKTDWLVGVGEFFDSEVGHVVSKDSLHGKIIQDLFNGDAARFRREVDAALHGFPSKKAIRAIKPDLQYPIGTTGVVSNGPHRVFLVAMSRTDLTTAKASSTVPLLWDSLKGALQSVHNYGNGNPLSLPLIGNGRSSVNIEPQHLLRLIVLALVDFGRNVGLPKQINIIVPEGCFELLDIREIKRDWSKR
jgi:hypothetical protein